MKHTRVNSSHIFSVAHDPMRQVLQVRFNNGSLYEYHGVSNEQYRDFLNSDSQGEYFHQNFKHLTTLKISGGEKSD
jgi:hypothetical protein